MNKTLLTNSPSFCSASILPRMQKKAEADENIASVLTKVQEDLKDTKKIDLYLDIDDGGKVLPSLVYKSEEGLKLFGPDMLLGFLGENMQGLAVDVTDLAENGGTRKKMVFVKHNDAKTADDINYKVHKLETDVSLADRIQLYSDITKGLDKAEEITIA